MCRALEGVSSGDHFGQSVAGIGDVDADGYADFVVGAPDADPNGRANAGQVRVYSGLDGGLLLTLNGTGNGDRLGSSVAGVGDVDADGVPDFIAGAPEADPNGLANAGSAVVISGATGALLFRFDGGAASDQFGKSVAGAGDADADGTPDFIVGAWWADPGGVSLAGSAYVYSGATGAQLHRFDGVNLGDTFAGAVAGVGDIDGDGRDDLMVGAHNADPGGAFSAGSAYVYSGATGGQLFRLDGALADDWFGISVGAAGDVDLDGVPNLAVGADGYTVASMGDAGIARVYSGADGSLLHQASGTAAGNQYGSAVAGGGDQDGDGLGEVLIGSSRADPGGRGDAGLVEVLGYFPGIFASADRVSAAAGGTVVYAIDFPDTEAGFSYALLASLNGTGPTVLGGIDIPLTQDSLLNRLAGANPPAVFGNPYGVLNFAGDASSSLVLPAGFATPYIGRTVYLAAVSFQPPATGRLSSVAVTLGIDP